MYLGPWFYLCLAYELKSWGFLRHKKYFYTLSQSIHNGQMHKRQNNYLEDVKFTFLKHLHHRLVVLCHVVPIGQVRTILPGRGILSKVEGVLCAP